MPVTDHCVLLLAQAHVTRPEVAWAVREAALPPAPTLRGSTAGTRSEVPSRGGVGWWVAGGTHGTWSPGARMTSEMPSFLGCRRKERDSLHQIRSRWWASCSPLGAGWREQPEVALYFRADLGGGQSPLVASPALAPSLGLGEVKSGTSWWQLGGLDCWK